MMPSMRYFSTSSDAGCAQEAQYFLRDLEASRLIGPNPLGGSFRATEGVGWTLTAAGFDQLLDRFPTIGPLLKTLAPSSKPKTLHGRWRRLLQRPNNAFYLNLLVLPPGQSIAPHVDATLRDATQCDQLLPTSVSVLWLNLPKDFQGGHLRLYDQERPITSIAPEVGKLVHFQGHLRHEVTPMVLGQASDQLENTPKRISLVCERYSLPKPSVKRLLPISTHTRTDFRSYLEQAKAKPLPQFELD